jgi:hypothetical protein
LWIRAPHGIDSWKKQRLKISCISNSCKL